MPGRRRFAVRWTRAAAVDLESILDHLASENVLDARRICRRIRVAATRLDVFPQRGRIVPELKEQDILIYREVLCFPWRVIYRIEARTVWVLGVIDGRRNLEDLLLERFLH